MLPMDEVLVLSAIDLSGRPYLNFDATFTCDKLGELDTEMVKEFFYADFLQRCNEPAPESPGWRQQPSYGRGVI